MVADDRSLRDAVCATDHVRVKYRQKISVKLDKSYHRQIKYYVDALKSEKIKEGYRGKVKEFLVNNVTE